MSEQRRRAEDSWHLDKKVSVAHLLTSLLIVGGLIAGWIEMNTRVTRLEVMADQTAREVTNSVGRIENQLGSLNAKFDKLIDRELAKARNQ